MRISRCLGALGVAAALAAPACAQTATPPASTMTPPGSTTPVPVLPGSPTGPIYGNIPPSPYGNIPASPYGGGLGQVPGYAPPSLPGPGVSDILAGTSSIPLSLTLGGLDGTWRRMTTTGPYDLGAITQAITSLIGSTGAGVYYTKGQSLSVGATTYLVTYRTQPKLFDITTITQITSGGKPPAPERLTPQTPLTLTLLNLQAAGSLTDIRAFNLQRELADSAAAAKAYNDLVSPGGPSGTPAPRRARPRRASPQT